MDGIGMVNRAAPVVLGGWVSKPDLVFDDLPLVCDDMTDE